MTAPWASRARSSPVERPVQMLWLTKGLGRGGAERLLVSMARRIDPARASVHVAYVLPHKDALAGDLTAAGAQLTCLGGPGGQGWLRRLRRLLADGGYDLVHTHSPVVAAAARVLAPRGTALVHTEHNMWPRYRLPTRIVNAATIGRNARVLAVSDGVAATIRPPRLLPGRPPVQTLLHGIDPSDVIRGDDARARARAELGLGADDLVVGTVGNLTPKKDHRTLLRAVASLDGPFAATRAVVIGDGPLRDQLEREVAALGLTGRAQLLGSRDDVPALLPAFDVFAMSSLHEGLSIALVEALAAGVPCVATRVGGIPEVVGDGEVGVLVPPRDPRAFADALTDMLGSRERWQRMVAAAPSAADRFSIDRTIAELEAIYDEVLA